MIVFELFQLFKPSLYIASKIRKDNLLANNSTIKYIIALGLIAISAIVAGVGVQRLIKAQKKSASVINWSGKQRMHSQRIAFFANSFQLTQDSLEKIHFKENLIKLRKDMMTVHQGLLYGSDSLNLPSKQSSEVNKMYFKPPLDLNKQVINYLSEVDTFLYSEDSLSRASAFKTINKSASHRLLKSLNDVVLQYVLEKNKIVKKMEITVIITVITIIVLLILEYFFIFKPLMRSIQENKQELTRQNTRLESLNQDLEQFIYAASHDLKTPIRGLHNLMQFLEADFSEQLKEHSKEYIGLIKNRVQRINVLIDGLMRFGAISRERTTQTEYDLDKFLHRFIKNYNSETVQITILSKLPTITTNPIWINEIFSNLIENAIKHSDKAVCEIFIGHIQKPHYYQFYIEDNGSGIDKKYHDKMFKLFQTLNREEQNPTAGIGLAIVKKVVTELGGKVWISQEIKQHFTIYFTIPKKQDV